MPTVRHARLWPPSGIPIKPHDSLILAGYWEPDRAAGGPGELPFSFPEDSKHAYYLVFDFEIEVTGKFGSTTARAGLGCQRACC